VSDRVVYIILTHFLPILKLRNQVFDELSYIKNQIDDLQSELLAASSGNSALPGGRGEKVLTVFIKFHLHNNFTVIFNIISIP
jgi:hypothetical protein